MGNIIDREVRKGKQILTTQIPHEENNQLSHIINEQSHSSMRHGITYKKAIMNGDIPYSACTNVSLPFGNLTFVWRFGNFNPVGPAATPLCPARRPAAVTLTAVRARVRRQRRGT